MSPSEKRDDIRTAYASRYENVLKPLAASLQQELTEHLAAVPRIDRIAARAKSVDRFMGKALKTVEGKGWKYDSPLDQIQDQVGARVIAFYLADVNVVDAVIRKYFTFIETKTIEPLSNAEFGYFGRHFIVGVPTETIPKGVDPSEVPKFFELQIKTLFQHAWAEAEHDLAYKPGAELDDTDRRRFAFTAAQAWGADMIFDELFSKVRTTQGGQSK